MLTDGHTMPRVDCLGARHIGIDVRTRDVIEDPIDKSRAIKAALRRVLAAPNIRQTNILLRIHEQLGKGHRGPGRAISRGNLGLGDLLVGKEILDTKVKVSRAIRWRDGAVRTGKRLFRSAHVKAFIGNRISRIRRGVLIIRRKRSIIDLASIALLDEFIRNLSLGILAFCALLSSKGGNGHHRLQQITRAKNNGDGTLNEAIEAHISLRTIGTAIVSPIVYHRRSTPLCKQKPPHKSLRVRRL